jgi:DNA-binding transcriptional ArsR family regulator
VTDLPTKMDKMLKVLEIVAESGEIPVAQIAKKLHKKIASIKIYLSYLEELGLIYVFQKDNKQIARVIPDYIARSGDIMIAVIDHNVIVWRCPFTDVCEYYNKGCPTIDKCMYLTTFLPALRDALTQQQNGTQTDEHDQQE